MSKIYDDWERLVAAVLRREDDRRVALDSSRDPSFNSSESSSLNFGASSGVHDPDFDRILPSYHLRHAISKPRTAAGYESKKDLHDSSISHSDRGKKVGYESKKDLRDSSIPLSDRGKRAGYESKEYLHDSSISHSDRGKRAGYESKEDLHDSSISHFDRGKKAGYDYELKKDPRDSSNSLSDRGKKAGYESREDLHNKSSNFDADSYKKKVVIRIEMHDDREKQKAMKAISGLPGIDSVAMIMKEKKMTIVGDFDPIHAVSKLRKMFPADIITIGPAKELQENKIDVKEIRRKNQIEVDERKKAPSDEGKSEQVAELVKHYQSYNPYIMQQYDYAYVVPENDPNSCVIS